MKLSDEDLFAAAAAELGMHSSFLILSHANPDVDALGSQLALAAALEAAGKRVRCINESSIPRNLHFLPGVTGIARQFQSDISHTDALITCDCATVERVGDTLTGMVRNHSRIINIDHHISNDLFGTVNLVVHATSSTSEIIYQLLLKAQLPISADIAQCLFAGIAGDTGFFRYESTSAATFSVAQALVQAGAAPSVAAQHLCGDIPLAAVKLHAEVLRSIDPELNGRLAVGVVTTEMLQALEALPEHSEGLVERLRDIEGVKVAVLVRREQGFWKASLRSKTSECNVSAIAAEFGGGGHKMAAAFRSTQPLDAVIARLRELVSQGLGAR